MSSSDSLQSLIDTLPQRGQVQWIGLRPARRSPLRAVPSATAVAGQGLEGDHYGSKRHGKRQVTLIQAEHLPVVAAFVECETLDPALLRRNIVVAGINLLALKDKRFYIGEVLLEGSGYCHPCSRMEEALGEGGYNAMRGHGGLNARVLEGGNVRVGDSVVVAGDAES